MITIIIILINLNLFPTYLPTIILINIIIITIINILVCLFGWSALLLFLFFPLT